MRGAGFLLTACALAAVVPFFSGEGRGGAPVAGFPGWPERLDGVPLEPLPLPPPELRFAAGFPGKVAAFRAGEARVVLRFVPTPTRRLHSAWECYRATGFAVRPLPLLLDSQGRRWGAFAASRDGRHVRVAERVEDAAGLGFTDVSAWYWAALLGRSRGPWWVTTRVEPVT